MISPESRLIADFDELLELLRLRVLRLSHQSEIAEARVPRWNQLVQEIWRAGLMSQTAILGRVIETRPYAPAEGGHSSGQVFQAALLIPGGVGVLLWNTARLRVSRQNLGRTGGPRLGTPRPFRSLRTGASGGTRGRIADVDRRVTCVGFDQSSSVSMVTANVTPMTSGNQTNRSEIKPLPNINTHGSDTDSPDFIRR